MQGPLSTLSTLSSTIRLKLSHGGHKSDEIFIYISYKDYISALTLNDRGYRELERFLRLSTLTETKVNGQFATHAPREVAVIVFDEMEEGLKARYLNHIISEHDRQMCINILVERLAISKIRIIHISYFRGEFTGEYTGVDRGTMI